MGKRRLKNKYLKQEEDDNMNNEANNGELNFFSMNESYLMLQKVKLKNL